MLIAVAENRLVVGLAQVASLSQRASEVEQTRFPPVTGSTL
jgi:hypothetical protein